MCRLPHVNLHLEWVLFSGVSSCLKCLHVHSPASVRAQDSQVAFSILPAKVLPSLLCVCGFFFFFLIIPTINQWPGPKARSHLWLLLLSHTSLGCRATLMVFLSKSSFFPLPWDSQQSLSISSLLASVSCSITDDRIYWQWLRWPLSSPSTGGMSVVRLTRRPLCVVNG